MTDNRGMVNQLSKLKEIQREREERERREREGEGKRERERIISLFSG